MRGPKLYNSSKYVAGVESTSRVHRYWLGSSSLSWEARPCGSEVQPIQPWRASYHDHGCLFVRNPTKCTGACHDLRGGGRTQYRILF